METMDIRKDILVPLIVFVLVILPLLLTPIVAIRVIRLGHGWYTPYTVFLCVGAMLLGSFYGIREVEHILKDAENEQRRMQEKIRAAQN